MGSYESHFRDVSVDAECQVYDSPSEEGFTPGV